MPRLNCQWCKKEFYSKHSTAKFCNKAHGYAFQKETPYKNQEGVCQLCHKVFKASRTGVLFCTKRHAKLYKAGKIVPYKTTQGLTWIKPDKNGIYVKDKVVYENKIIDYVNAPMGKAFIGLSKKPLMPNKNGIGFQGVLLQDESRQFVQCSSCGDWMKRIGNSHLKKCSKGKIKSTKDYKKAFGLYSSPGLVSDETSLKLTKAVLKIKDENRKNFFTASSKVRFIPKRGDYKDIRQHQNKLGTCPEQLKFRLKEFILRNRELPAAQNRGKNLYKILWRRFGSLGGAMKYYNLPSFERIGTTYIYKFPKGQIFKFNINQFDQREELFEKMVMECEIFTNTDRDFYLNHV